MERFDRSVSDVFQDILRNVQEIMRAEVSLAKAELREEASKAAMSATWLAVGAVCALFALLFGLWTLVYALALIWPMWAATLLLAGILAVASAALIAGGRYRLKNVHATPLRTTENIKENVEWLKQSSR
jgi:uncharacterized membrane protein YqjE